MLMSPQTSEPHQEGPALDLHVSDLRLYGITMHWRNPITSSSLCTIPCPGGNKTSVAGRLWCNVFLVSKLFGGGGLVLPLSTHPESLPSTVRVVIQGRLAQGT